MEPRKTTRIQGSGRYVPIAWGKAICNVSSRNNINIRGVCSMVTKTVYAAHNELVMND
jgi:hypothetical protein